MHELMSDVDDSVEAIDDPIVFDAIDDPLRWRLWRQLARPMSVRELAVAVGVGAGRLYYHLERLERFGWVEVVEERPARTRPERVWRARRAGYRLTGPALEAAGSASGADVGMAEDIADELAGGVAVGDGLQHRLALVVRRGGLLDADQAAALQRELVDLARRYFPGDDPPAPDASAQGRVAYRVAIGLSSWT